MKLVMKELIVASVLVPMLFLVKRLLVDSTAYKEPASKVV
jgi:hypothetical protein